MERKWLGPVVLGILVLSGASATSDGEAWGSVARRTSPYVQDWEDGLDGWTSRGGDADPVVLVIDPKAPTLPAVQRVTRADGGGYRSPEIRVTPGRTYCVRGWIRWAGGGWPSIGMERLGTSGVLGCSQLIGRPGYPDGLGGQVTPIPPDTSGWRWYAKQVVMPPDTVAVRLEDRMLGAEAKPGEALALFDGIGITEGPCPPDPTRPDEGGRREGLR